MKKGTRPAKPGRSMKKEPKRKAAPATGRDPKREGKKRPLEEVSDEEGGKARRKKKKAVAGDSKPAKKSRRKEPSADDLSEDSEESEVEELFGEKAGEKDASGRGRSKKDQGPFGSGDAVEYRERSDDSSEEDARFRDAPAVQRSASNQARLMRYAKKNPGRLASRMLMKMRTESARGIVGGSVATHYLLTMMLPQLGSGLNLRSQRELRTLCLAVDLLARLRPAQAADLLSQRIKAIEKAGVDGHWGSAQYLELMSPEQAGLLEREEEIFTNKEYLLEMKLRSMENRGRDRDHPKGGKEKGGKKGRDRGKGKGNPTEKKGEAA